MKLTIPWTAPHFWSLSQNYPNPFDPLTNVDFQLPNGGLVKVSVFDVLGREVAVLVNDELQAVTY